MISEVFSIVVLFKIINPIVAHDNRLIGHDNRSPYIVFFFFLLAL